MSKGTPRRGTNDLPGRLSELLCQCGESGSSGLENKPVAVAGDPALRSGIILAACPVAKKYGVSTAERLGEALKKCPELIVMRPHMQHYIDVSLQITKIYEEFTDLVEIFSIDEQFLDVTASLSMFGDPITIAKTIQQKVLKSNGGKGSRRH